jgi:tetratricopeptide (TPR) repeat protein
MFSERGNYAQAIGVLEKASRMEKDLGYWEPPHYSRPVLESLGKVYLKAKQWDQARGVYESLLQLRPNSGHALVGIARSYELAGQKTEAREAYEKFLDTWKHADPDLMQVREAILRLTALQQ